MKTLNEHVRRRILMRTLSLLVGAATLSACQAESSVEPNPVAQSRQLVATPREIAAVRISLADAESRLAPSLDLSNSGGDLIGSLRVVTAALDLNDVAELEKAVTLAEHAVTRLVVGDDDAMGADLEALRLTLVAVKQLLSNSPITSSALIP